MRKLVLALTVATFMAWSGILSACGGMQLFPSGSVITDNLIYVNTTSDEVQAAYEAAGLEVGGAYAVLAVSEESGFWEFWKWVDQVPDDTSPDETQAEAVDEEVPPPPPPPMFVQATPDSFELFSDPAAVSIPEQAPPLELEETVIIS